MARVAWMHLCDHAFLDQGGKPCVIGIFEHLYAPRVPTVHQHAAIVARIDGQTGERPGVRITLQRPDGGELFAAQAAPFEIGPSKNHFLLAFLAGIILPDYGPYEVELRIASKVAARIGFTVEHP